MYAIDVQQPKTLDAAAAALKSSGGRPLAGGQSLIAAMKLRLSQPGTLVDLAAIPDLKGVRKDGNRLVIGAMTRHADVAASDVVKGALPALAKVAEGIGDRQVRNMGTLGGSLANNDPAADWPAAVLGCGATVRTNVRAIAADDFFKGMFETALAPDEIITAVEFPLPARSAYAKFPNPASRFALVGAVSYTHLTLPTISSRACSRRRWRPTKSSRPSNFRCPRARRMRNFPIRRRALRSSVCSLRRPAMMTFASP